MAKKTITRRQLIKDSAVVAIGTSLFMTSPMPVCGSHANSKIKVVLIRDEAVLDDKGNPVKSKLEQMLIKALFELTGKPSDTGVWVSLLNDEDVLGIKTNAWRHLGTPRELEEILQEKAHSLNHLTHEENSFTTDCMSYCYNWHCSGY